MEKSMNPRSAKNKGARLQKWVCQKIADIFDIEFDNQDDQCLIHSREMGQSGTDIILRGDIYNKFPYAIECKNTEKLSLYPTIEQAKNNTQLGQDWLIVHKKNRSEPIVIMDWEAFEKLFKRSIK
jgi:hypothetical protein